MSHPHDHSAIFNKFVCFYWDSICVQQESLISYTGFFFLFPRISRVCNHYCNSATFVTINKTHTICCHYQPPISEEPLICLPAVYIYLLVFLVNGIIHHFYYHILSFTIMRSRLIYATCHFIHFYHKTIFYLTYIECPLHLFLS